MTLPTSGQISMSDINNEFALGSNLNAYRGATWYTEDGSTGTFSIGAISFDDFHGKRKTTPFKALTLSSNQQELNLRTWAVNNGWDQVAKLVFTVAPGVYIWSNNVAVAALTIDGSWPNGVTVINNGYIIGKGGTGGDTTYSSSLGTQVATNGITGGSAISIAVNCSVTNNSYIGGGGGGGAAAMALAGWSGAGGGGAGGGVGGGEFGFMSGNGPGGAGGALGASGGNGPNTPRGGGGGRIIPGTGGTGGSGAYPSGFGYGGGAGGGAGGFAQTATSGAATYYGGAGGSGGSVGSSGWVDASFSAAAGGGGGGWGASGGAGRASGGIGVSISSAGGGGRAIALNGYTCTRSGTGTTYGSVS